MKVLFVILGTITLVLGVLGIVIPGLPTTPFLLLTAALYVRSSERLYQWLIQNKRIGRYIVNYRKRRGMTIKQKIYTILLMWTMISISCVFCLENTNISVVILAVGVVGTVVMGFVVPTFRE